MRRRPLAQAPARSGASGRRTGSGLHVLASVRSFQRSEVRRRSSDRRRRASIGTNLRPTPYLSVDEIARSRRYVLNLFFGLSPAISGQPRLHDPVTLQAAVQTGSGSRCGIVACRCIDGTVIQREQRMFSEKRPPGVHPLPPRNQPSNERPLDQAVHVHPRQLCRPQASQGALLASTVTSDTFHFTPTSCSWLNAVEGFFAKLSKRRLKRGVFQFRRRTPGRHQPLPRRRRT